MPPHLCLTDNTMTDWKWEVHTKRRIGKGRAKILLTMAILWLSLHLSVSLRHRSLPPSKQIRVMSAFWGLLFFFSLVLSYFDTGTDNHAKRAAVEHGISVKVGNSMQPNQRGFPGEVGWGGSWGKCIHMSWSGSYHRVWWWWWLGGGGVEVRDWCRIRPLTLTFSGVRGTSRAQSHSLWFEMSVLIPLLSAKALMQSKEDFRLGRMLLRTKGHLWSTRKVNLPDRISIGHWQRVRPLMNRAILRQL